MDEQKISDEARLGITELNCRKFRVNRALKNNAVTMTG